VCARKTLFPALRGRGLGEGAVLRRKADREAGKHFFFEKKKQKTSDYFGFGPPGESEAKFVEVFCFFFSKKKFLLS
jgi:hypothetical protein